jgi:branched-chain amino acid transport system substrate-binding protein
LAERLLELGETAIDHIVKEVIERKPPALFNTLVGESSYVFMRTLHEATTRAGLTIPILSCSLAEPELKLIGENASVGCITSSAYFESIADPENRAFVARWKARHGDDSIPCVDGQSTYVCVMLLARAIRRAGSADVNAVRRAAANHRYHSPQGPIWVDPDNNHCFLTPRLARSVHGGQFRIFWEADAPERPDPYLSNLDLTAIGARAQKSQEMNRAMKREMKRASHLRVVK